MSPAGQKRSIFIVRFARFHSLRFRSLMAWSSAVSVLCLLLSVSSGCGRGIGDACETSLRCSASGTRLCDMTQPGGYCTLAACQPGNCPSDSVCVTFWQNTEAEAADRNRLSANYCMRKCDERSDCRDDEGYDCLLGDQFGIMGEAVVEGDQKQRFCAQRIESR
jgi:hypothetical protein